MTNLPARADGGIDWGKIKIDGISNHPFVVDGPSWGIVGFAREAVSHKRERCMKAVVEAYPNQYGLDAAAAIRKMED